MSKSKEDAEKKLVKKQENRTIRQFKKEQRKYLLTSRFNNKTLEENKHFREASNFQNGCVYCTPEKVNQDIPYDSNLMVLEMNNEINKIVAVGSCLNKPFIERFSVYNEQNYNRYNYIGRYRICREDMNDEEEAVFKALDILCFYGNDHMKRGHGIKLFPAKLIYNCMEVLNIPEYIDKMFSRRFSKK